MRRDPDAWLALSQPSEELCRLYHGIDCKRGCTTMTKEVTDPKDLKLPTTTKEFAQYLRDIATMVDRIPDRPLQLSDIDVEIGFYYGNPMFPQMPTGLHFEISYASTEYEP